MSKRDIKIRAELRERGMWLLESQIKCELLKFPKIVMYGGRNLSKREKIRPMRLVCESYYNLVKLMKTFTC